MAYRRQPNKSSNFLLTPHFSVEAFADKEDQWFIDTLIANNLVKAACGQREVCPTTGAEHMQIFVIINGRKRESGKCQEI